MVSSLPSRQLSINASAGHKIAFTVIGTFVAGFAVFLFDKFLQHGGLIADNAPFPLSIFPVLVPGLMCAISLGGIAHAWVYAGWLTGTHATVRSLLGTRTVDLSTAVISVGRSSQTQTRGNTRVTTYYPAIIARDPRTGTKIKIPTRNPALKLLPPDQLTAIAEAIIANRPQTQGHERAFAMAQRLRGLANDPLAI